MKGQPMLQSRTWQWVRHHLASCPANHILCLIGRYRRPMPEGIHHVSHLQFRKPEPWYIYEVALFKAQGLPF